MRLIVITDPYDLQELCVCACACMCKGRESRTGFLEAVLKQYFPGWGQFRESAIPASVHP